METQHSNSVEVVISGLGPTGLTLAHLLGKRGISVVVLEREPRFYGNARAVYTDDECMRIFQAAGMAEELARDMLQDAIFQWVLPDGRVLNQLIQKERPYGWPANNLFYQPCLETSLADALARYPHVCVQRGRELTGFTQDGDGVTVFHVPSQGAQYSRQAAAPGVAPASRETEEPIRAKYLVACDGGRSAVRAQLGISMTGRSFPNPWIVVDIREKDGEDCLRHLPYFNFVCDPDCPTVSCRQPKGHHRFEFMLMPGQTAEHMEDPATVRQLLARYVDVDKVEILRSLVYTFNALVADRWRDGRVFLAGDAAHMTPQFVGQGMNAGVRDAYNLAWKLAAVLQGRGTNALLDTYQTERRPHARAMIDTSIRMKNYVSVANPVLSCLRNVATRGARITPGLKEYFSKAKFKPRPRYQDGNYFGHPRRRRSGPEGEQIPQPTVAGRDGRRVLLDEVLGEGYGVIGFGVDPRALLSPADLGSLAQLEARYLTIFPLGGRPQGFEVGRSTPAGLPEMEDCTGELTAWLKRSGATRGAVAIVRPDKFTYALVSGNELSQTVRGLADQLGMSAHFPAPP